MKRFSFRADVILLHCLVFTFLGMLSASVYAKPSAGQQQPPCPGKGKCSGGEGDNDPGSCDKAGANPISPGKTNAYREITDITTFGAAPIEWSRHINSRLYQHVGNTYWEFGYYSMSDSGTQSQSSWQSNWTYEMRNQSSTVLTLRYPDGNDYTFTCPGASPAPVGAQFIPSGENGDRIYKTHSSPDKFMLRTASGEELDFERTTYPALHLVQKRNGLGFYWNISYDANNGRMSQITNNFGRWIKIERDTLAATPDGKLRIKRVYTGSGSTPDGREVIYTYSNWQMGSSTHSVLTRVDYRKDQHADYTADYTYVRSYPNDATSQPLLETASDPMLGGAGAMVKYVYWNPNTESVGSVKEEHNLQTNQLIVSFPEGGGPEPVVLEGDGTPIVREYDSINGVLTAKGEVLENGQQRLTTYERDANNT
jgi:hypothetical protein